eukprot:Em0015g1185a
MKSGLSWAMSGNVSIQMDPPDAIPHHLSRSAVLHSRSASWSFTRGQGRGASDLSFVALNPLTTVIRELVPSLGHADSLYNCFIFQIPQFTIDLWNLLWCICVTDYIVRFSTMMLKAVIALLPSLLLSSRNKGKYYMLFEHASNLYRTFLPTPLWFRYLSNSHSSGVLFATVITALYVMIKGVVLFGKIKETYRAALSFVQDPFYGATPTREELHHMGQTCPICQEDVCQPVMLQCRHIFCEDCVLRWLDRQSSCPLCRALVATDPQWRDGSTAAWPQLF